MTGPAGNLEREGERSHEVLRRAVDAVGVKKVAADLKVSGSLVYKWCSEEEGASGARNPLDRIAGLIATSGDLGPIEWLCQRAGGTFVPDPEVADKFDAEHIAHTQRMLHTFSELLRVVSASISDDDRVDPEEARRIRVEWQRLKAYAESFVIACERGLFDDGR